MAGISDKKYIFLIIATYFLAVVTIQMLYTSLYASNTTDPKHGGAQVVRMFLHDYAANTTLKRSQVGENILPSSQNTKDISPGSQNTKDVSPSSQINYDTIPNSQKNKDILTSGQVHMDLLSNVTATTAESSHLEKKGINVHVQNDILTKLTDSTKRLNSLYKNSTETNNYTISRTEQIKNETKPEDQHKKQNETTTTPSLADRVTTALKSGSCIGNITSTIYPDPDSILVCGNIGNNTSRIVLYTTMYYSGDSKMFIFWNVLNQWVNLGAAVQPVLYLTDAAIQQEKGFIAHACNIGWVIFRVPQCNQYGFPVLRAMVRTVQIAFPNSTWIGYANGDILFTTGLVRTLDYLSAGPVKMQMAVGQRHESYLYKNQSIISDLELNRLATQNNLRGHHAIDYFITPTRGFPWHNVPPFVVGRSGFDNWLVWFVRNKKMAAVDITESVNAVHQGVAGLSETKNSHRSRAKGAHSNEPYFKGIDILSVGRTGCLKYKTQELYGNPFLRFPILKPGHVSKEDLPQMMNYCIEAATLRLLLENGFNFTSLYDPRVKTIIQKLNLTDIAFGDSMQYLWIQLQNMTAKDIPKANLNKQTNHVNISAEDHLYQKAFTDFNFLTPKAIRDILYMPSNSSMGMNTSSSLTATQHSSSFNPNSKLVLMERTKYPRHCKQLHDPRLVKVKVIHTQ